MWRELKKIATEKGINVSFVCREIGKSRGYISQMLASGRDFPDEMLVPAANALGVPVEELTGEEQKEKPNALITTAVSKVKQPVDLIDRDKECIAVKDGIGLFKCSAAAFQCSPVFRKCSCRLLCCTDAQF